MTPTSATIIEVNPAIPDAATLRHWMRRHSARQAINPPFPSTAQGPFDPHALAASPVRCLYTLADLDEAARQSLAVAEHASAPGGGARLGLTEAEKPVLSTRGFLSVLLVSTHLHDCARRGALFAGECCRVAVYANDAGETSPGHHTDSSHDRHAAGQKGGKPSPAEARDLAAAAVCAVCGRHLTHLRLNPRILGPVLDETGMVGGGRLVLSDGAWADLLLLGSGDSDSDGESQTSFPLADVPRRMTREAMRALDARLRLRRVTLLFAWTGDEAVAAAGRVCVMGVRS